MTQRTLDEIKLIEEEMHEFLANVPLALNNPFAQHQVFLKELSVLEKTIKRLKMLIEFLSKLNPARYLKWMHEAFSGAHTSAVAKTPTTESAEISSPTTDRPSLAPASGVVPFRKKKKPKK